MNRIVKFFLFIVLITIATRASAQDAAKAPVQPLPLTGWDFATNPKISNSNNEAGEITFLVEIDSVGNVLNIKVIKSNVSDELAQKCEAAIRKMSFVKKTDNAAGSALSKGTITFVFKEK